MKGNLDYTFFDIKAVNSILYFLVRFINDSRYVGMSIYNVVVLCLITAPVSLVISSQADASFAFVTTALVFCCFLSMALIFLPKVFHTASVLSMVCLRLILF